MNLSKEAFVEKQKQNKRFVLTKVLEGDTQTPITLFQKLVGNNKGFLLESKEEGKGRYSIIGRFPFAELKGNDLEKVKEMMLEYDTESVEDLPFVGGAVGYIGYDIPKNKEKIKNRNKDVLEIPDMNLMFVEEAVIYDHKLQKIILMKNVGKKDSYEEVQKTFSLLQKQIEAPFHEVRKEKKQPKKIQYESNTSKDEFVEKVIKAKEHIFNGDIFQVVLSQRISTKVSKHPFEIYRVLRGLNPSPYLFYMNFGDVQLAGSSPEMMAEIRNEKIYTCPIAGTYPRGKDEKEDEENKEALLKDEKEIAEHVMLVDLARNDVGRICQIGSVGVPKLMEVEKYSHVMHIVSKVEGKLRKEVNSPEALITTLPAGTLSGAPKIRAMQIIEELEEEKRGVYGGAVGYLGFDQNMDTCIAIRTILFKENKAYIQAGAGIVLDSIPEKEYEESFHKARALLRAIEIAEGEEV